MYCEIQPMMLVNCLHVGCEACSGVVLNSVDKIPDS